MKVSAGIFAGILAVMAAGSASAAVLTASPFNSTKSPFTINFTDQNNNGLFDIGDPFSFSGVTFNFGLDDPQEFTGILGIPQIDDISAAFAPLDFAEPFDEWVLTRTWRFSAASGPFGEGSVGEWTYLISGLTDPAVVPLPAGLPLLLAAIGALALLRRRPAAA